MIKVTITQPGGHINFGFNRISNALEFVQTCLETCDELDETIITVTQGEEK